MRHGAVRLTPVTFISGLSFPSGRIRVGKVFLNEEETVGIIAWILIGLLAGAIAKLLLPGKDPGGIIITMLIGIVGGLLGGWLGKVIFGVDSIDGFFDLSTWIAAIVGSLILLVLYRVVTGNRRSHRHA